MKNQLQNFIIHYVFSRHIPYSDGAPSFGFPTTVYGGMSNDMLTYLNDAAFLLSLCNFVLMIVRHRHIMLYAVVEWTNGVELETFNFRSAHNDDYCYFAFSRPYPCTPAYRFQCSLSTQVRVLQDQTVSKLIITIVVHIHIAIRLKIVKL